MPLLTLTNAHLAYGHWPLLDKTDLQIDEGERIALIGRNGTGKSSLLRVLAGEQPLDDGLYWRETNSRAVYVPQEPPLDPQQTVFEAITEGAGPVAKHLLAYQRLIDLLSNPEHPHEDALEQLQHEQTAIEAADGWTLQTRVDRVLAEFSLTASALISSLSGGQRKRVALAQAWIAEPELLMLDEPTNHLDFGTIEWLETTLNNFPGTLLFVTHDRRFLDRVATRIIELDRGALRSYPGNYTEYQARKERELADEAASNARFDKFLAQEEIWIRKGVQARRTRNEGRVRRLQQLRVSYEARRNVSGTSQMALDTGDRSGHLVAELEHVNYAYHPDKPILTQVSARILRGDKVALIGPNGVGKSTLLRLILGEIEPDTGKIQRGTRQTIAYFDQHREQLNPEATLMETVSPGSEWIEIGNERKHVMSYLGDFLFAPERARSPVKSLSGGERNRLLLARLFARPSNILVLDEPTNDLDIETLELLEELLAEYPGTLFLVSHDRAFVDQVVTQSLVYEGDGHWQEYPGGFTEWQRQSAQVAAMAQKNTSTPPKQKSVNLATTDNNKPKATSQKLSYNEQRELTQLPELIAALEQEQTDLSQHLADPTLYQSDHNRMNEYNQRLLDITKTLETYFERWSQLEEKQAASGINH